MERSLEIQVTPETYHYLVQSSGATVEPLANDELMRELRTLNPAPFIQNVRDTTLILIDSVLPWKTAYDQAMLIVKMFEGNGYTMTIKPR